MADRLGMLLEAEKRGILPSDKVEMLAEARNRGLVPATEAPIPEPVRPPLIDPLSTGTQIGRSVSEGATLGFFPEIVGAGQTALGKIGVGPERTLGENIEFQESVQGAIPPEVRIPGNIAGGLATGAGIAGALPKAAISTIPRAATVAATEGAIAGAGFAPPGERLEGAATGAAVGGGLGAAAPVVGRVIGKALSPKVPKAPTIERLRELSSEAYDLADDAGLVITQNSFGNTVRELGEKLTEAGIDPTLHPKATAAFTRLSGEAGDLPLRQFETLRRVAKGAASSIEKDERRIARIITNHLDDYLGSIGKADTAAGDPIAASKALTRARELWTKASKGETVETMLERATNRAPQFSQSGMENALRTEFRQLAQNPKRMRLFNKQEQEAIKRVAKGGPAANALRMIGKFAPRGPVSGMMQLLTTGALTTTLGPAGTALGIGALGVSEAARTGARAITQRNARLASELMRRGAPASGAAPNQAVQRAVIGGVPALATELMRDR